MDNSDYVLDVKNLNVTFGKNKNITYSVQDISFKVAKVETLGVVGESGCGKSTSVLALMGLLDKKANVSGAMNLCGEEHDLSTMKYKDWRNIRGTNLAMVFQDSLASLNPLKRIGEQVAEAINNYDEVALKNSPNQSGYSPEITSAVETYLHSNGWLTNGNVKCVETGGNGLLRKLGASGIYIPYTGQGHCDATYTDHVKLMIKAHETAHGYGITDEGEADYVAFMSMWNIEQKAEIDSVTIKEFKYSALLSLLRTIRSELHGMNDSLR